MNLCRLASFSTLILLANVVACSSSSNPPTSPTDTGTPKDTSPGGDTADTADTASDDTGTAEVPDSTTDSLVDSDGGPTDTGGDTGCVDNVIETAPCGKCGTKSRLCIMGAWTDYGLCGMESGDCVPTCTVDADCVTLGVKCKAGVCGQDIECGKCGSRSRTCDATCAWVNGACSGEKLCNKGDTEVEYYSAPCSSFEKRTRTCDSTCSWGAWGACTYSG